MTPIERQILENQKAIMTYLRIDFVPEDIDLFLESCLDKTSELLNPKREEEPCCEMPEEEKERFLTRE
jgi:hypothetical protein